MLIQPGAPLPLSRLLRLHNDTCSALVYPERGFQLFGFEVTLEDGRTVEVVHTPPGAREPADRRYGNPVLFPAVGVSNGSAPDSWDFQGRALAMPPHGWARNVYWQVEAVAADSVTAVLVPHPGLKAVYPFDFELTMEYSLVGRELMLRSTLRNLGGTPMPFALGFHPYLRAPLTPAGTRAGCTIALPAGVLWRTTDGWKTIEKSPSAGRTVPATDPALPGSIVLADTGATSMEVRDPGAGLAAYVSVQGSPGGYPIWVVWSATPESPYVCLEPWTDAPNALNRGTAAQLPPGGTQVHTMKLGVRGI